MKLLEKSDVVGKGFEELLESKVVQGVDRIMTDREGTSICVTEFERRLEELALEDDMNAVEEFGPSFVLLRNDGWQIAAPTHLLDVAFNLNPDEWVAFLKEPSWTYEDIDMLDVDYLQQQ